MGWRFVQSSSIAGSHQTDQLVDSVRRWLEGGGLRHVGTGSGMPAPRPPECSTRCGNLHVATHVRAKHSPLQVVPAVMQCVHHM